jgi:lysophospholipase L1-like esterase
MDRRLNRAARIAGTAVGALAGLVAVQLIRLRRMEFLPGDPGFWVNHVVMPSSGTTDGRALRLVALGDSTTAGVGVERAEDSLPYLLAERLAAHETARIHVVSYGWAGARAADVAEKQLPRAIEPLRAGEGSPFLSGAHVVAVVIGSNDATHQTPPGRYRASLRTTMAGVRAAAPNARIVLAGIPRFRGALRAIEPLITLADGYARLLRPISRAEAERVGAAYADLAGGVPPRIERGMEFLSSDNFHPSVVGYSLWADVIFEALIGQTSSDAKGAPSAFEAAGA